MNSTDAAEIKQHIADAVMQCHNFARLPGVVIELRRKLAGIVAEMATDCDDPASAEVYQAIFQADVCLRRLELSAVAAERSIRAAAYAIHARP